MKSSKLGATFQQKLETELAQITVHTFIVRILVYVLKTLQPFIFISGFNLLSPARSVLLLKNDPNFCR